MPARKNPEPTASESLTFEAALDRLQTIVGELEGGALSLEDSIARYEEGMKLSRRLTEELQRAEKRIERLVQSGNGEPRTQPMESTRGESRDVSVDPANGPRDPDDPREGELQF